MGLKWAAAAHQERFPLKSAGVDQKTSHSGHPSSTNPARFENSRSRDAVRTIADVSASRAPRISDEGGPRDGIVPTDHR